MNETIEHGLVVEPESESRRERVSLNIHHAKQDSKRLAYTRAIQRMRRKEHVDFVSRLKKTGMMQPQFAMKKKKQFPRPRDAPPLPPPFMHREVERAVVLSAPGFPVGGAAQRGVTATNRDAVTTLPVDWILASGTVQLQKSFCERLGLIVEVWKHMLRIPQGVVRTKGYVRGSLRLKVKKIYKDYDLVSLHFMDPRYPKSYALTQGFATAGSGAIVDCTRAIAVACAALRPPVREKRPLNPRLLMLGVGTGLTIRALHETGWNVTGVDVSPVVIDAAQKFFGAPPPGGRMTWVQSCAFEYLKRNVAQKQPQRFDVIVCDMFTNEDVASARGNEFALLANMCISRDGYILVHRHTSEGQEGLELFDAVVHGKS
eukprot:Hpha_TRINITY_DN13507_c0_g1::TRINITY_DN13507_c0_g1_i1::g.111433::m.111433